MVYSNLLPSQGLQSDFSSVLIAGLGCFAVKAVASYQESGPVVWSNFQTPASSCVAVVAKLLIYRHG